MGMLSPYHSISHNSPFPHSGFPQLDAFFFVCLLFIFVCIFVVLFCMFVFPANIQSISSVLSALPIFCQWSPISWCVLLLHDLIHPQQLLQTQWLLSNYLFIFYWYLLSSLYISYNPSLARCLVTSSVWQKMQPFHHSFPAFIKHIFVIPLDLAV